MSDKKILLVGHCNVDGPMLQDVLGKAVGVPVQRVNDRAALNKEASADALLLVNRELVGDFGTSDGVELISQLASGPVAPATMLVSDLADAQKAAVQAGARPGFGKAKARDRETAERVKQAVGA